MAGYIEDRWLKKKKDPETGKRERTDLWGTKTKRYRVCGIPGVRRRSFDSLDDAKTWKATAIADTKRQEFIDPREGQITLGDYFEKFWWKARRDPVGTKGPMESKIRNHILPHLGRYPLNAIGDDQLRLWLAELRDKRLEESTIEVIWVHLTSIFRAAVGKRIPRNPCSQFDGERPKGGGQTKARAWTQDEVLGVREGLAERYRLCVDLGVAAGLRQGEVFGFSPEDIDEKRALIHLRRQLLWDPGKPYCKLPKGNKERDVPLSPGLLKAVLEYQEKYPPVVHTLPWRGPGNGKRPTVTVPLLITTWHKNPVNSSTFNKKNLKPALAAAGIIAERDEEADGSGWEPSRDKMFHRFRHTYASVQLGAGEDVVSVSHWMGHSSPEITLRIYAHFMPDQGTRGRTAVDAWLGADSG